ncbi:MAG TPA: hypothetical protein VGZ31_07850 [Chthoniobacterales bacterium]|nr:hypothetical protein [Chthoniobacterales bacterium]
METSLRPYFRKPFLLSKPEKYFYNVLREIFATVLLPDEWRVRF